MSSTHHPGDIARRLAAANPRATLPCPVCAGSLRASRLEEHLAKVHPGTAEPARAWRGVDRAALIPAALVGVLATATCAVAITVAPELDRIILGGFVVVLMAVLGVAGASLLDMLPAELRVERDALELRYLFGLARRTLRLPPRALVVGTLLQSRTRAGTSDDRPHYDVVVGTYLRLEGGRRTMTLASSKGTGIRKHWRSEDVSAGPRRRMWDIMLSREDLVAIEYHLAAHGALALREPT